MHVPFKGAAGQILGTKKQVDWAEPKRERRKGKEVKEREGWACRELGSVLRLGLARLLFFSPCAFS